MHVMKCRADRLTGLCLSFVRVRMLCVLPKLFKYSNLQVRLIEVGIADSYDGKASS